MICLEDKEKEELIKEIETLKEKLNEEKELRKKAEIERDNNSEKYLNTLINVMDTYTNIIAREQDKGEITVKTIKEITKQNAFKEASIVGMILIFLLIYYIVAWGGVLC